MTRLQTASRWSSPWGRAGREPERNRAILGRARPRREFGDAGERLQWASRKDDLKKKKTLVKSDQAIQRALSDVLALDPRVNAFGIDAEVRSGSVTLQGKVGTLRARSVAAELARNTTGVVSVDNQLSIEAGGATPSPELTRRVQAALERSPMFGPDEVTVSAQNGSVLLDGIVEGYAQKAEAEDIASGVPGVVQLENNLGVRTPTPLARGPYAYPYTPYVADWEPYVHEAPLKSDPEIREDIRREMVWNPFVDSDQIRVRVENGVATLTGIAENWQEVAVATQNAFEGGAVKVENKLIVH